MRLSNLLFCTILSSSIAISASGSDKASLENGIWTGVIGDNKVMACIMRDDDPAHTTQSAYFYLRYSKLISLIPDPTKKILWYGGNIENPTGIWAIKVKGDQLTGNWSNLAKTRTLPISLKRFKSIMSDNASDCSPGFSIFDPVAYSQALSEKVSSSGVKSIDGKRYRVLSALDGAVTSIELLCRGDKIAEINELLANELKTGISYYYGCQTFLSEVFGEKNGKQEKPDYHFSVEPLFWNDRWISFVERTDGYCGGVHPFEDYSYSTWDQHIGKKLNL